MKRVFKLRYGETLQQAIKRRSLPLYEADKALLKQSPGYRKWAKEYAKKMNSD